MRQIGVRTRYSQYYFTPARRPARPATQSLMTWVVKRRGGFRVFIRQIATREWARTRGPRSAEVSCETTMAGYVRGGRMGLGSAAKMDAETQLRIRTSTAIILRGRLFRSDLVNLTCRPGIAASQAFESLRAGLGEDHSHIAIGAVRPCTRDRLKLGFPAHHFVPVSDQLFFSLTGKVTSELTKGCIPPPQLLAAGCGSYPDRW